MQFATRSRGTQPISEGGSMQDRVIVEVDEGLSDLIPGFLTHKRTDIIAILKAITRRDYAEIARTAHRIKGEGGSYGFDTMTELARSLEVAAATRDDIAPTPPVRQLLNDIDHVGIVFQPSTAQPHIARLAPHPPP